MSEKFVPKKLTPKQKETIKELGKAMAEYPERHRIVGSEIYFLCWCDEWHPLSRLNIPHKQTQAFRQRLSDIRDDGKPSRYSDVL